MSVGEPGRGLDADIDPVGEIGSEYDFISSRFDAGSIRVVSIVVTGSAAPVRSCPW